MADHDDYRQHVPRKSYLESEFQSPREVAGLDEAVATSASCPLVPAPWAVMTIIEGSSTGEDHLGGCHDHA
jgi:hypothetical protein